MTITTHSTYYLNLKSYNARVYWKSSELKSTIHCYYEGDVEIE